MNLYNRHDEALGVRWLQSGGPQKLPAEARRAAGFEMSFVQQGVMPSDWKPMQVVGTGAMEIRVHVLGEWRVIVVAKIADAVYVLHAFQKKSRWTRREEIELARKRYREIGGKG